MRDAGGAARLQNAVTARHRDGAVGIGNLHLAAHRHEAGDQRRADAAPEDAEDGKADGVQRFGIAARRLEPHVGGRRQRAGAGGEAEQRQKRHQQGEGIEKQRIARIPVAGAYPEPETEAAMEPGEQQRHRLPGREGGIGPHLRQDIVIAVAAPGQYPFDAGADDMVDEQERECEAEQNFQRLA